MHTLNSDFEAKVKKEMKLKMLKALLVGVFGVGILLFLVIFQEPNIPELLLFVVFFSFIEGVMYAITFWKEAKKLDKLITGLSAVAYWEMDLTMQETYIKHKKNQHKPFKYLVLGIIAIILLVVFYSSIEPALSTSSLMFRSAPVFGSVIVITLILRYLVNPIYYNNTLNVDPSTVIIGPDCGIVQGEYYIWSGSYAGLKEVKAIQEPFEGLAITYWFNAYKTYKEQTINIPSPSQLDLADIVAKMQVSGKM